MKNFQQTSLILKPIVFALAALATAMGADSDFDGLDDAVETNTGIYLSPSNTGTDPANPDSDGDFLGDGFEVRNSSNPNEYIDSQSRKLKIKKIVNPKNLGSIANAKEIQLEGNTLAAWESSGNGSIHLFDFTEGSPTYKSTISSPDTSHDWPAFGSKMSLIGSRLVTGDPITWISGIHDGRGYQYNISLHSNPQFQYRFVKDAGTATYIGANVIAVNGFSIFDSRGSVPYGNPSKVHIFREDGQFYRTLTDGYGKEIDFARNTSKDSFLVAMTTPGTSQKIEETSVDIYNIVEGEIYPSSAPRLTLTLSYTNLSSINERGNQHSKNRFALGENVIYAVDDDRLRIFTLNENQWKETTVQLKTYTGGQKFQSTNILLSNNFLIASSPNSDCRDSTKGCVVIFETGTNKNTLRYRETITKSSSTISGEFGSYVALNETTGHMIVSTEYGSSHEWDVVNSNSGNWVIYEGLDSRVSKLTLNSPIQINTTGAGDYQWGTNATITATPNSGFSFTGWTGDATGSNNPTTILMDSDKTVGATFAEDTRDPDNDGLTNYQELVTYGSNPDLADTDGDGINDGAEVAQGRSPKTAEPVITNITATQRSGTKFVDISYDLASVTPTVKVTLEISSDGGLTYNVPVTSTTGAIGNGVTIGTGKTIAWNAGADWDGNFSNQMRFRLIADDLQVPGFSLIPAGAFTMGRTSGDTDTDAPPVNVTVSQFYMGKYEVTKAEWDEVRAWAVNNGYTDLATGAGKANNHPVQTVSWWDVIKWCNARSQKEGLTPCYTVSGSVMKTGTTAPTANWTANGYRLPTEAEWEKAARGGVSGVRFPWGTDTISHSQANFNNSGSENYKSGTAGYHPTYGTGSTPYTSPIGSFVANGYGLHDMAGNVWEWCWDWYGASNYENNSSDPRGAASGTVRVDRGGSWRHNALNCRASRRNYVTPSYSDIDGGLRVARSNSVTLGISNFSSAQSTTVDIRNFSLFKTTTTNGSISGTASYLSGSSATVTATPQPGYLFGSWTGDASGSTNPTIILMDSDKTVGATFVEDARDPDNDGLTNYQEIIIRLTNPDLADSDADGVNDGQEVTDATNPLVADSDGDGLSDGEERTLTTDPLVADTDGDTYLDGYEVQFTTDPKLATSVPKFLLTLSNNGSALGGSFAISGSLAHGTNATVTATPLPGYLFGSWTGNASGSSNPTNVLMDADKTVGATFVEDTRDPDNDGLTNYQEIIVRLTNPDLADSDSDGVNDGQEVTDATNPLVADTDGDGLSDGEEKTRGTNPLVTDTDADGVNDAQEVTDATNPLIADSDGDGLTDSDEKSRNTNPLVQDSDGDGVNDAQEVTEATNPLIADTDEDGLSEGQEKTRATNPLVADTDSDGVNDGQEVIDTTDPLVADTDADGITDGEEKTMGTNPVVADTDGDGLTDGEEKTRTTNPLAKDTDGDGLSDREEELITKTNPLLADTDGDSISDALEDTDNDGISNLREVTELKTDPLLADSDADGLSDTYELVYKGTVEAFAPRIGDRLRFELRELVPQGTLKLVGTLPTGLKFNATTGVLEGKLTGRAGVVKLTIQVLEGTKIIRTIPFTFTLAAFPSNLIGTWQVLLEDANGEPQGMITTTVKSPGTWSATYDAIGTTAVRSASGTFDLTPAMERAAFPLIFPVSYLTSSFSTHWDLDGTTALAGGTYAQGTLRGFRLAKTGEFPTASRQVTMVIDQGEQDGYQIPAGLGWATGTLSTSGSLALSGQLGDARAFSRTINLGATGQAILWVKPYRNLNSTMGGIISLRDTGVVPQTSYAPITNGLRWQRLADNTELSYNSGFGPIAADAMVNPYLKPASALALAANLELTSNQFRNVTFDGGGLPNTEQFTALPERFVMDSSYKLNSAALPGRVMALWQGGISASKGTFTGTIALDASNSGILKGIAGVSGVVFRRNDLETVGAGLIKIPTTGVKGSFRTGAFLMDR